MDEPVDPFRYCVYCGADCYVVWYKDGPPDYRDPDEVEHEAECPAVTGLFPVTMRDLGMRGPHDPYAHGMRCMDCGSEFQLGDFYAHRPSGEMPEVMETVCVGCRVLSLEGT